MTYEVYTIGGAPRPWRVMLGLVAKAIEFEVKTLDGGRNEHKAPAFLALNPRGRVPVLRNGDFVLTESLAILSFLEKRHPSPPIFGTTAEQHARIWQLVSEGAHDLNDRSLALLRPLFALTQDEASDELKTAAPPLHEELKRLEGLLSGSRSLFGEAMTAADCVCFPHVRLVVRGTERSPKTMQSLGFHPFKEHYPRLSAWVERIEALPGYARTFPSHWRSA